MTDEDEIPQEELDQEDDRTWGDRLLSSDRPLSPRHRKLAELAAQGKSNQEIAKELNYSESRVSILKSNSRIIALADEIRERVFEETVGARLKKMTEPALNEIERCLNDRSNKYPERLKTEVARWLVEKIDGKAAQKIDIGENMLGVMMDKLDAMKNAGQVLDAPRDVTPQAQIEGSVLENQAKEEEDPLKAWIAEFTTCPK